MFLQKDSGGRPVFVVCLANGMNSSTMDLRTVRGVMRVAIRLLFSDSLTFVISVLPIKCAFKSCIISSNI